jgi:hypothetical protein
LNSYRGSSGGDLLINYGSTACNTFIGLGGLGVNKGSLTSGYNLDVSGSAIVSANINCGGTLTSGGALTINNNANLVMGSSSIASCGTLNCPTINATNIGCTTAYCGTVSCSSIGSGGSMFISTGSSFDIAITTNRLFFQNGANIMSAINWGSTATNGGYSMTVNGTVYAWATTLGSDDRIKGDEVVITDATTTLLKLRPEKYKKYNNFQCTGNYIEESGLIAQEVYNIDELRHLVSPPQDASGNLITTPSSDPNIDPDYSNWGTSPAGLNYIGLIPYLVKSIQELNERIYNLEHP